MLNKDQALAVMDARIIAAETEKRRRLERRTRRFTMLYPALRGAPLEVREDLVAEASRHALRSWPVYVLGLLLIAALLGSILAPDRYYEGSTFEPAVGVLVLMWIPSMVFYLRIRSYIRHLVRTRYRDR